MRIGPFRRGVILRVGERLMIQVIHDKNKKEKIYREKMEKGIKGINIIMKYAFDWDNP